jgi:hypothetical protein
MNAKWTLERIAWEILRLNTISDAERGWLLDTLPHVYIHPVVYSEAYGGPEEGGWWYRTQTVIRDRIGEEDEDGDYCNHPKHLIMRLDKALLACRRLNDLTDELVNRGRYGDEHVGYEWSLGKPEDTPARRPYYC